MAVRPNFTGIERIDGTLRVTGASGRKVPSEKVSIKRAFSAFSISLCAG